MEPSAVSQVFCRSGHMQAETTDVHAHEEHQLLLVTEGLMLFEDTQQRHVLSGWNLAFVPCGVEHKGETLSRTRRVSFVSLYFQGASFEEQTGHCITELPSDIVVFPASRLLTSCLLRLRELGQGELEVEPHRTILRLLYLLFLEESTIPQSLVLPRSDEPRLKVMLEYLEQSFDTAVGLVDLERRFRMSRRTIQRLFQRECGMNFSEYLRLRRVFSAALRLSTTDAAILDIALDVGYDSLSAFYTAFSRVTGQTPRQYRKEREELWGQVGGKDSPPYDEGSAS